MLFPSIPFLAFFAPVFLLGYLVLPWKNLTLLLFSLLFYAWGEREYVFVLLGSIAINYLFGLLVGRARREGSRKALLGIGVVLNCGLLLYYKAAGFVLTELLPQVFGTTMDVQAPHLPLGISFFTFQGLSYLVDVYRRETPCSLSPLKVAVYVSMFPQLVAGPIVRFKSVARALERRHLTYRRCVFGLRMFIVGLSQKVLIANTLGVSVDQIFALPGERLDAMSAWVGVLSYSLQIYYDFSGYSNMAIAMGLLLGFRFPRNFRYPYASRSITEFWRRWHISLSTWFRDYLYIPLGGNRKGSGRTLLNLLVVFVLCGLWHGVAYTFLAWGLLHGLFMVMERLGAGRFPWRPPVLVRHLYVISFLLASWTLFRAEGLGQAMDFYRAMFGGNPDAVPANLDQIMDHEQQIGLLLGLLFATPGPARLVRAGWARLFPAPAPAMASPSRTIYRFGTASLLFLLSSMYILAGAYSPFLYFRF